MAQDMDNVRYLFEPRGVAVIGASSNPSKIGYQVVDNIVSGGYAGGIYPVNPSGGEIMGHPVYASVGDIEGPVDIACLVIPAGRVFDAVKECALKKVKNLVVITSGFSEVGNIELERDIALYARKYGMRVLGPNIFGIYSAKACLNATFGPKDIMPGQVAIITQSGAIGVAMIGKTAAENIGLSAIVSVGNKSDLDEADLVEYLVKDEATSIIMMYIEGVKDGARFIEAVRKATMVKPVIVIKSGRSKRGAVAVASHTGSLAGADTVFDSIMRQCGVLRAESIKDALNWSLFFSGVPHPAGEKSVIITNGGGIGVLATDACEKYGVELFPDIETLEKVFQDTVPAFGSRKNPVDLTGGATAGDYADAIQAAIDHDEFDSIITLFCETAGLDSDTLVSMIEEKYEKARKKKPIVFILFGGEKMESSARILMKKRIPVFTEVYDAVSAMGAIYRSFHHRIGIETQPPVDEALASVEIDEEPVRQIIEKARSEGRNFLLSPEAAAVMRAAGISMPASMVAKNIRQSVEFAQSIGYPVVMKIVSRDILHKSDAGGVAVDLDNESEVMDAWEAIMHSCRVYNRKARIEGIEVCKMVRPGTETIVGARRDRVFGPVIMFGLGGIYVEVMKDVAFRSLPVTLTEASEMVSGIKSYPLLMGVRGEEFKDVPEIILTIVKIQKLIMSVDEIEDIEINPLTVYDRGEGCLAVDARILISKRGK